MTMKPFELLKLVQGRRRDSGTGEDWKYGILSDSTGSMTMTANPSVAGQPGKVWVRFPAGSDGGVQQYYPPVAIWEGIGAAFLKKGGRGVWVGYDPRGQAEVKRGDRQDLMQVNITPAVTNPLNREGDNPNRANPFGGLVAEPVNTPNTPGWLVTVYPLWYDTGSSVKFYPGTEALADKVDLVAFKPDAGEYCYALLWLDTDTNTLEAPTSSTETVKTSTLSNADKIAAIEACYAAKPNANCIPIKAFYLDGDATSLIQTAPHIDLRQMVNMIGSGAGTALPVVDTTAIVKGSADATKLLRFEVDGFTTGTTRVLTPPNYDGQIATLAGTETLTGKTIDGDLNTVQDLPLTAIKTVGANTKRFLTRDASGVPVDTTNPPLDNLQHDHTNAANGGQLTDAALSAAVGIAKGGTGQTSKTPAFDALAPTTTKGDLIVYDGSDNVRKAVGTPGYGLISDPDDSNGLSYNLFGAFNDYRLEIGSGTTLAYQQSPAGTASALRLVAWTGKAITLYYGNAWRNYRALTAGCPVFNLSTTSSSSTTNGSNAVTGLDDTTQLCIGMKITGTGIPANTTISGITGATAITMNNNATATGTPTLTFNTPANKNFDVFAHYGLVGGVFLGVKLGIKLWTNDTTRAAPVDFNADNTYPFPVGDDNWRFLGTGRTTGTDSQIAKDDTRCFLTNFYNVCPHHLQVIDSTNSWSYTSTTIRQANGAAANKVEVVTTLDDRHPIDLLLLAYNVCTAGGFNAVGIGEDVTNAFTTQNLGMYNIGQTPVQPTPAALNKTPSIGYHYYSWNERGNSGGTFYGDNNVTSMQSGMKGTFWS